MCSAVVASLPFAVVAQCVTAPMPSAPLRPPLCCTCTPPTHTEPGPPSRTNCRKCAVGSVGTSGLACTLCAPGTFSPSAGLTACFSCPTNTFLDTPGGSSEAACRTCSSEFNQVGHGVGALRACEWCWCACCCSLRARCATWVCRWGAPLLFV